MSNRRNRKILRLSEIGLYTAAYKYQMTNAFMHHNEEFKTNPTNCYYSNSSESEDGNFFSIWIIVSFFNFFLPKKYEYF